MMNSQRIQTRVNASLEHMQTIRTVHKTKDMDMQRKWSQTQNDKRDRQIRDLQFEMATQKIRTLKKVNVNKAHMVDQVNGIEAFERNLRKSGLGGDDTGGERLHVTYEDPELFSTRLEKAAAAKWPSDSENSDFLTQLKRRTTEKKAARHEKIRRRRRMLVEQNAMASQAIQSDQLSSDDEEEKVTPPTRVVKFDDDSDDEPIRENLKEY